MSDGDRDREDCRRKYRLPGGGGRGRPRSRPAAAPAPAPAPTPPERTSIKQKRGEEREGRPALRMPTLASPDYVDVDADVDVDVGVGVDADCNLMLIIHLRIWSAAELKNRERRTANGERAHVVVSCVSLLCVRFVREPGFLPFAQPSFALGPPAFLPWPSSTSGSLILTHVDLVYLPMMIMT